jgi:FKBP-type peptidyl-prolyl cis-trans isomerase
MNCKKTEFFKYFLLLVFSVFLFSCRNQTEKESKLPPAAYKEPLIKANKKLAQTEDEQIEDFIHRYGWNMKETGTGLRYMIYREGQGQQAKKGQIARINYSVSLLTGDEIYSSEETGTKEFLIGKGGVESGLEEGILLLKKGDRAKFIIPSHLAFGLMGDADKIPAKATLVYDIELIDLK